MKDKITTPTYNLIFIVLIVLLINFMVFTYEYKVFVKMRAKAEDNEALIAKISDEVKEIKGKVKSNREVLESHDSKLVDLGYPACYYYMVEEE